METPNHSRLIGPDEAREILGKNFIGPEIVEDAYDVKIDPTRLRALPFRMTLQEAINAAELGNTVHLALDQLGNGQPMTIQELNKWVWTKPEKFQELHTWMRHMHRNKFRAEMDRETGRTGAMNISFQQRFANIPDRFEWRQTSPVPIAQIDEERFLAHTDRLIDYIRDRIYKNLGLPKEYKEMIEEYDEKKSKIQDTINESDDQSRKAYSRTKDIELRQEQRDAHENEGGRLMREANDMAVKLGITRHLRPSAMNLAQYIATLNSIGMRPFGTETGIWTSTQDDDHNILGCTYAMGMRGLREFDVTRGDNNRTVFSRSLSYPPKAE